MNKCLFSYSPSPFTNFNGVAPTGPSDQTDRCRITFCIHHIVSRSPLTISNEHRTPCLRSAIGLECSHPSHSVSFINNNLSSIRIRLFETNISCAHRSSGLRSRQMLRNRRQSNDNVNAFEFEAKSNWDFQGLIYFIDIIMTAMMITKSRYLPLK